MPAALAAEALPPNGGGSRVDGSHMGEAGRGHMGSEFHGERFAHDNFHHGRDFHHDRDHRFRVAGPFFFDDYGSNCWQSERIHTPAGWRWHRVWACY